MESIQVKINTRVSLVVLITDDYTAEARSGGNINVFIKNHPQRPIRKTGGYYVFTNLPPDTFDVVVQSDVYLEETVPVSPGKLYPADPVLHLSLKPGPFYPFPAGSSIIRAAVRDAGGSGVPGVAVNAVVISEDCARAKLTGDGAKAGAREIGLVNVSGKISAGETFMIKDKKEGRSEYCLIAGVSGDMQGCRVDQPLKFKHPRGALLLPAVRTRTDSRGEVVVYFRDMRAKHWDVILEFVYEGKQLVKEVKVNEGEMTNLGIVQMFEN